MRRLSWSWSAVALLVVLVACTGGEQAERFSPIDPASSTQYDPYIVVMHGAPGAARAEANRAAAAEVARAYGLAAERTYGAAIVGFAARVPAGRLAALHRDPRVAYVERDAEVTVFAQDVPTGIRRIFADANTNLDIDGADDFRVDVDVAVIDTGIDFEHPDLNVAGGVNCSGGWPWNRRCVSGGDDDHYHGTHVAGTIGALDNADGVVGVAPGARLWAVKVLNSRGSGYTSWIVAGIDWVAANADTIEVANMSLGGSGYSQAEHDAIQSAVNAGVAFAVAAGNDDDDANLYSPAAFGNVLTVSALADFDGEPGSLGSPTCRDDQDDTLADFSNWGDAVDIAAPGVCITSTYPLEEGGYGTISGTSMASPHVAGALALLASKSNPGSATDVYGLYDEVIAAGNVNWTDDSGDGIMERLLDVSTFAPVLIPGSGGGGTNAPPVASFTGECSDLTCAFTDTSTDADGSVTSWSWVFGDGAISNAQNPSRTYATAGTYTVTLTVTDDDSASSSVSHSVTATAPIPGAITLTVTPTKVRGTKYADLDWSGANGAEVDVYRDGAIKLTTANDGAYSDLIGKAGGTYTYRVCEAGTTTCSKEATVTF